MKTGLIYFFLEIPENMENDNIFFFSYGYRMSVIDSFFTIDDLSLSVLSANLLSPLSFCHPSNFKVFSFCFPCNP